MGAIPETLRAALRPVTVIVGHYGAGKTNFSVNLAVDLAAEGREVTVVDLDIVNPYFRATEQRALLEGHGVRLVAPAFAEAGSSLDVPSLTGKVGPAIQGAGGNSFTVIDVGGDDAGSTALGRYAREIEARGYAMLYVANRFRNLVQDPHDALENLREIEAASRLKATGIVNNSHLKDATTAEIVEAGMAYAEELSRMSRLHVVCTTVPQNLSSSSLDKLYPVRSFVRSPWEQGEREFHGENRS